jgi:hypothetical protein
MKIHGTAKGGALGKKDFGVAFGGNGASGVAISAGDRFVIKALGTENTNNKLYALMPANDGSGLCDNDKFHARFAASIGTGNGWSSSYTFADESTASFCPDYSDVNYGSGNWTDNESYNIGSVIVTGNSMIGKVCTSFSGEVARKGFSSETSTLIGLHENSDGEQLATYSTSQVIKDLPVYTSSYDKIVFTVDE